MKKSGGVAVAARQERAPRREHRLTGCGTRDQRLYKKLEGTINHREAVNICCIGSIADNGGVFDPIEAQDGGGRLEVPKFVLFCSTESWWFRGIVACG